MNVRQKLSLAAMCIALPALASAQAAAPAAPAPAPAPAVEIKPYGFALLTLNQTDGTFKYPEYPSVPTSGNGYFNHFSARQSRFGVNVSGADGGLTGAKLGGKLEFDFMGPGATAWDSAPVRLRYFYGMATWDNMGPGKLSLTLGQTDGLVAPLHPELGAYIALPTFMQAGNLTRRSPQIRATYAFAAGPLGVTAELAALNSADTASVTASAGNASGRPDFEGRLQGAFKQDDIGATVGVAYHTNRRKYGTKIFTASVLGVDANVEATKYLNLRGEWYTSQGGEESYSGAFSGFGTDGKLEKSTGFWAQAVVKPLPVLWIMGGFGQTTAKDYVAAGDVSYSMMNVGVLSNVSKNWRLGLEYTTSKKNNPGAAADISGSEVALSSRFSF